MSAFSMALPTPARRAAFGKVVANEARLTSRQPIGLIAGLGIPVVLLVIFGELPVFHQAAAEFGGLDPFDVYVPILIVFSLAMLALLGLSMPLASYRELGVLRRLSTTPVPPSWLLAAQGILQTFQALAATAIIVVAGIVAFGAPVPKSLGGFLLSVALTIAGLIPIGLTIAAVARSANAASVIGRVAFFPMMFFTGLWLPRAAMPPVLLDISNYTPLGAAVQAIQASMLQGFPSVAPLLVLGGYAGAFGYLAKRFFRWE
jgi:ABC-2 type transport system permease protein